MKKMTDSKKTKKSSASHQASKKTDKKKVAKAPSKVAAPPPKTAAPQKLTQKAKNPEVAPKKSEKKSKSGKPAAMEDQADDFDDQLDGEMDEEALLADEEIGEEEDETDSDDLSADDDDGDDDDDAELVAVEASDEIVLTDAEGNRYCRARDCDQIAAVDAYCRYHYLLFWKKIQVRKKILADGKLERYVDELTSRYPDKFLEMIRRDLRTEKDFLGAIQELEIDESGLDNEYEEDTQSFVDEIRGMGGGESESVEDDF
ncbi:MAG: hypothetical protein KF865_14085 [Bdellovibrionaceae bacterium]|nr:hypothetical protein [Pseudobdellovibrionaceae bacterium]